MGHNVRAICWIVPKKYLLLLDQTILFQFRSSIDRPLNLPQYPGSNNYFSIPEEKYIINNWGLMKKNYFGWSGVYFIFILHLLLRADTSSFFTANIASQISKRHLSAWNIWRFSRRFSRNVTPRAPKNTLTVFVFYLF